jgi:hypothetical protein
MVLCGLLLTAFLSAGSGWNKLTFQGKVTGTDGNGYRGPITTGVKVFTTANYSSEDPEDLILTRTKSFTANDGVYTIVLDLSNTEIDALMTKDDIYFEVYLCKGSTDNIFSTEYYRLLPRVHMLGVPIAFKAKGVNIKHSHESGKITGSSLGVGYSGKTLENKDGISIEGRVGIGTANPQEKLHVVADGERALLVPTINVNGQRKISATRVHNVRWE